MKKAVVIWLVVGVSMILAVTARAQVTGAILLVRNAPTHGIVVARVDLSQVLKRLKVTSLSPTSLQVQLPDGRKVPTQFVPESEPTKGWLLLQLPKGGNWTVQLRVGQGTRDRGQGEQNGTVRTKHFTIVHEAKRMGGLPSRIVFAKTGKTFDTFVWNDRVYHRELGGFHLRNDPDPKIQVASQGEIATVVRVRARYCQPDGKQPPSQPEAVYDWFYFHDLSLLFVTATVKQREAFAWHELHFLELNFPDESFRQWSGGEPLRQGKFEASQKSFGFPDWGALIDGRNVLAVLRSGQALFHDGRGGYGTYLHAHGDAAWQGWQTTETQFSAWLLVGAFNELVAVVRSFLNQLPTDAQVIVTLPEVRNAIVKAKGWHRSLAEKLEAVGRFEEAVQIAAGKVPKNWLLETEGDLGLALERTDDGIRLQSLFDRKTNRELLATPSLPLFQITLRHLPTKREVQLNADSGWKQVHWHRIGEATWLLWQQPKEVGKGVIVSLEAGLVANSITWQMSITNLPADWSILRVTFPQLAIADLGEDAEVFFPRGPGEVQRNLWRRSFTYRSLYPNGWATMQFVAAYNGTRGMGQGTREQKSEGEAPAEPSEWGKGHGTRDTEKGLAHQRFALPKNRQREGEAPAEPTGIYVGVHDPNGSAKEVVVKSEPQMKRVILAFEHPVPNMGAGGIWFSLGGRREKTPMEGNEQITEGEVVWQLLRGDWFDAAMIYRYWVRKEAKWFPDGTRDKGHGTRGLGQGTRIDMPLWIRELCVWAVGGGAPKDCVPIVKEFAKFMGVPVGFHWYNWHQIPFDNDYPHYFPTKEGFAEGVQELQQSGVFVMPYINGRLWDTRDKGMDDWQFSKVALPAATKREDGTPYTESYGSKEADGSDVKLAPMCPTTKLWQDKVREIVLRLFNEFGVNAVYIDQVAAAPPALCFDKTHGHPLGGGSWWNEGYWQMLDAIRKAMPKDRALTTECNAEPFVKWFDGYLTWHWQHDGQVPAFPAVYGGAIQMFGRAYRGGSTKDLALRMKAGQQLVFGEQIGWIDPNIVREKENAEFLRQVVRLRWQLGHYFWMGEMARPPRLSGNIPKVRADWQWAGEWWVETDAVLTGAWQLPRERKLVLLFVNVSDQPVTATLEFDGRSYGFRGKRLKVTEVSEKGRGAGELLPLSFRKTIRFHPRTAFALEISEGS